MSSFALEDGVTLLLDDVDDHIVEGGGIIYSSKLGYAQVKTGESRQYVHRLVTRAGEGEHVDHIDGNRLNCQRANLRLCTRSQNLCNRGKPNVNTTGFKGVSNCAQTGRFRATIAFEGKTVRLGRYDTPEEAACVYDEAARRLHGEFARLNFPDGQPAHVVLRGPRPRRVAVPKVRNAAQVRTLTHEGRTLTLTEWAREAGIARTVLVGRLKADWPVNEALTAPVVLGQKRHKWVERDYSKAKPPCPRTDAFMVTIEGTSIPLVTVCRAYGLDHELVYGRLTKHEPFWPIEHALFAPRFAKLHAWRKKAVFPADYPAKVLPKPL